MGGADTRNRHRKWTIRSGQDYVRRWRFFKSEPARHRRTGFFAPAPRRFPSLKSPDFRAKKRFVISHDLCKAERLVSGLSPRFPVSTISDELGVSPNNGDWPTPCSGRQHTAPAFPLSDNRIRQLRIQLSRPVVPWSDGAASTLRQSFHRFVRQM